MGRRTTRMLYSRQMSAITVQLSDELAERLRSHSERLPEILELGLRELNAESQHGYAGAIEVLELLACLPAPEQVLRLRPSELLRRQLQVLLQKSRDGTLSANEEQQWERYEFLEHLVRIAKTNACLKLGIDTATDV